MSEYEGIETNKYPNGTEFTPFSKKYIRVIYWSLMTLTTIWERPAPVTDLEFVFTGLTFLIGVFVFAAVVGNVGDVISNMNAARQEFQGRMDQIKSYLQHRQVDEKLQNRVKRWADYTWTRTQAIDEPALLQMLPDRLRTEIAINVHLKTLKKALVEYPDAKNILEQQAKVRMLKTKLVGRGSNVNVDVSSDAEPCSEQPMKKKDILLQVIKSANF